MSAVLKFKPRYTGFETREYVLAHERALQTVLARLLSDLGERIAHEVEREMAAEKVSLASLAKASSYSVKYFHIAEEVQFDGYMYNKEFEEKFPGVKGIRIGSVQKLVGKNKAGQRVPITRQINYAKNPSLHKCGSKCQNAKGKNCECSCGGANHGILS